MTVPVRTYANVCTGNQWKHDGTVRFFLCVVNLVSCVASVGDKPLGGGWPITTNQKKKKAVYKIRNKKHSFFFPQENPRKSSESSLIPSLQLPPQQPQFPAQKRREQKEGCDWLISTIDSIRLANRGVKATWLANIQTLSWFFMS